MTRNQMRQYHFATDELQKLGLCLEHPETKQDVQFSTPNRPRWNPKNTQKKRFTILNSDENHVSSTLNRRAQSISDSEFHFKINVDTL